MKSVGDALEPLCDVRAVENPWGADPADLDDQTYLSLVESAVPYAVWRIPAVLNEWVQPSQPQAA